MTPGARNSASTKTTRAKLWNCTRSALMAAIHNKTLRLLPYIPHRSWGIGKGKRLVPTKRFSISIRSGMTGATRCSSASPFAGGGEAKKSKMSLDILVAMHPSTWRHHIAFELAQYFVTDDPPASLVNRLEQTFQSSGGDMVVVLRKLFSSPVFWDPKYAQTKFKPPFRYVVSAMRANVGYIAAGAIRAQAARRHRPDGRAALSLPDAERLCPTH